MIKAKTNNILKQSILAAILIAINISCKDNVEKSKVEEVKETIEKPIKKEEAPIVEEKNDPNVFKKSLSLNDIDFQITATGEGSIQQLIIQPSGLKNDNTKITLEVVGKVNNAEIEDLDSDGFPELLIYTTSAGSGSYGEVLGYSANNGKSMSQIYFPPIAENKKINGGYSGHDEFAIVKKSLVQRFKIYNKDDSNSNPTGKIREIQYKLQKGEATKVFVVANVTEYSAK